MQGSPPYPHPFSDPALLELALTHASTGRAENNERLEFLGDAVLDLIVVEELYARTPRLSEGVMTEAKSWIVSRAVLADAARELGLHEHASFGHGMRGREIPRSILANLYEAVLGAIYLDGGLDPSRAFVLATLGDKLETVADEETLNPKQELQRIAQIETGDPPTYVQLRERGDAHSKAFLVAAEIDGRRFPSAWGRTRKEAERWAATEALLVLEYEHGSGAARSASGEERGAE